MGKALNQSISTFYGLHQEKAKSYIWKLQESKGQTLFDQKTQGKSTKIWTLNLSFKCFTIWWKKFAKQMNLDWEASINS